MSKKEIRRAARDAFPKAKGAQGKRGANTKRRTVGSGSAANSNVPRPPSVRRAVVIGALTAFAFFALIQWVFSFSGSTTTSNLAIGGAAFFLYAGLNYFMDWFKYRRYLKKKSDSGR